MGCFGAKHRSHETELTGVTRRQSQTLSLTLSLPSSQVWWNILDFIVVLMITVAAIVPAIGKRKEIFALVRVVRAFRILRSVRYLLKRPNQKSTIH